VIDLYLFSNAPDLGTIRWGKMPIRSQYILILLAVTFTWLMGLMGYARNAIRQHWHIYQVVQDTSVDAFSPTLGFAARVISVCVLLFLALVGFIFWLGRLSEQEVAVEETTLTAERVPAPQAMPVPAGAAREAQTPSGAAPGAK
jgi:cytochrome bd-type quinol oxidase subunit 1